MNANRAANAVVVVPAYNEAESISDVVEGLRARGHLVIVVDDGSVDGTRATAREAGAVTLRHPINRGQGAALQTGIRCALERGFDVLVTFDADGQHDPDDVDRMVGALCEAGADIALGSRFLGRAQNISAARRTLLRVATVFTNATTGVRLSDAHNGLRAMTAAAAHALRIRQDGMSHASEIIQEIRTLGLNHVEVPVTVRYTEYSKRKGQSGLGSVSILYDLFVSKLR